MFPELLDDLDGLIPEIALDDDGLPIALTLTIPVTYDMERLTAQLKETIVKLRKAKVPT